MLIVTQNPYELDALIFCTVFGCFMWSYKSIFNIFTSDLIMCCCQIDLLLKYFLFTGQTDGTQPLTGKSRSTATIPSPVLLSTNMQQLTIKTLTREKKVCLQISKLILYWRRVFANTKIFKCEDPRCIRFHSNRSL